MGNQDTGMGEERGGSGRCLPPSAVAKSVPLDGGPLFMIRFRVVILVREGRTREQGCAKSFQGARLAHSLTARDLFSLN